jgi:hypothetical protein
VGIIGRLISHFENLISWYRATLDHEKACRRRKLEPHPKWGWRDRFGTEAPTIGSIAPSVSPSAIERLHFLKAAAAAPADAKEPIRLPLAS